MMSLNILIISFILPLVKPVFDLSQDQLALLASIGLWGLLPGSILWGQLADVIGRKTSLFYSTLVFSVFTMLSALSLDYISLLLLRFMTGVGLGGYLPICFSLTAEFMPVKKRGSTLALLDSFYPIGTFSAGILSLTLVPFENNWRLIFLAVGVLTVLPMLMTRTHLFESPRYLTTKGRWEEAKKVVENVALRIGVEVNISIDKEKPGLGRKGTLDAMVKDFSSLWKPAHRKITIMLWFTWIAACYSYFGIAMYLPSILEEIGVVTSVSFLFSSFMYLGGILAAVFVASIVEKIGRKIPLTLFLIATGSIMIPWAMGLGFTLLFVALGLVWLFLIAGSWAYLAAYTPEAYPTRVRVTGYGWATAIGRLAGAVAPWMLSVVWTHFGLKWVFVLPAVLMIASGLWLYWMGVETKGKPLED